MLPTRLPREDFYEEYAKLVFDQRARQTDKTRIEPQEQHLWGVRHTLVDPEEEGFWFIDAEVDLRADQSPEGPIVRVLRIGS